MYMLCVCLNEYTPHVRLHIIYMYIYIYIYIFFFSQFLLFIYFVIFLFFFIFISKATNASLCLSNTGFWAHIICCACPVMRLEPPFFFLHFLPIIFKDSVADHYIECKYFKVHILRKTTKF